MNKKIIMIIAFLLLSIPIFGKILYVSNFHIVPYAEWKSVQSAIEAASSGDTIRVLPSPINYGNIIIEKPVTIIGEGLGVTSKFSGTAKLTRATFSHNVMLRQSSSGAKIIGFEFPYFPNNVANIGTDVVWGDGLYDIEVRNNWLWFIEMRGRTSNWKFKNNVVINRFENSGETKNNIILNNVINSIEGLDSSLFKRNNIFGIPNNINNTIFINNIFANENDTLGNITNSEFHNNYLRIGFNEEVIENKKLLMYKNIIGGRIVWRLPLGENDFLGGSPMLLYRESPLIRAADDGGEIGVFGGEYPFPISKFLLIKGDITSENFWDIIKSDL